MKTETRKTTENLKSLFIEGRLWFDKINGNTYHAVRIEANCQVITHIPITYGYENHYLQTALEWLKQWELVSEDTKSIYELLNDIDVYWVSYYTPKRELWKAEKLEDTVGKLLIIEELKGRN